MKNSEENLRVILELKRLILIQSKDIVIFLSKKGKL